VKIRGKRRSRRRRDSIEHDANGETIVTRSSIVNDARDGRFSVDPNSTWQREREDERLAGQHTLAPKRKQNAIDRHVERALGDEREVVLTDGLTWKNDITT